jgi:3-hydroxybutyryl-CoA dehydratase
MISTGGRPPATHVVTQQMVNGYAEVSGDRNPIHVNPEYARGTEFGRTIVHGQYLLVLLAAELAELWGPRWDSAGSLEVKFVRPAFVGDELRFLITEADGDDDHVGAEVEVSSGDRTLVIGTARCRTGGLA